jgi:hypothetical protein
MSEQMGIHFLTACNSIDFQCKLIEAGDNGSCLHLQVQVIYISLKLDKMIESTNKL